MIQEDAPFIRKGHYRAMNIYLVRHGESVGNQKRLFFGTTDYPLTEKGWEDAHRVAEKLKDVSVEVCYTSGLQRAYNTAEICWPGDPALIQRTTNLNEQHIGKFEGREYSDLLKDYPEIAEKMKRNWIGTKAPDGETYEDVRARVKVVFEEILEHGKDTMVVAHNGSLMAMLDLVMDIPTHMRSRMWFEHGSYSLVSLHERGFVLNVFNR